MNNQTKFLGLPILILTLFSSSVFAVQEKATKDQASSQMSENVQSEEPTIEELLRKTNPKILERIIQQKMIGRVSPGKVALAGSAISLLVTILAVSFGYYNEVKPKDKMDAAMVYALIFGGTSFVTTGLTYGILKMIERNQKRNSTKNFAKMLQEQTEKE